MKVYISTLLCLLGVVSSGMTGCATKTYVKEQIQGLQAQVDENRKDIAGLNQSDAEQDQRMSELSANIQEALLRAEEAGKLAKGKFLYEVQLTDESIHFSFDRSELSKDGMATLDALASRLKQENRNVYIEIQGHTDSTGSEVYNLKLGQARANSVMNYLYRSHGIPLHRMDTFSYGESKPITDNINTMNRAQNRRVTIVVME